MKSLNRVFLIGHVGQLPESKETQHGNRMSSFSFATNEKFKDKTTDTMREETQWHRVVCFGKLADIVKNHVVKGEPLFLEGRIKYSKYEDREGSTRYSTSIIAEKINMLGNNKTGYQEDSIQENESDDIPF